MTRKVAAAGGLLVLAGTVPSTTTLPSAATENAVQLLMTTGNTSGATVTIVTSFSFRGRVKAQQVACVMRLVTHIRLFSSLGVSDSDGSTSNGTTASAVADENTIDVGATVSLKLLIVHVYSSLVPSTPRRNENVGADDVALNPQWCPPAIVTCIGDTMVISMSELFCRFMQFVTPLAARIGHSANNCAGVGGTMDAISFVRAAISCGSVVLSCCSVSCT